MARQIVIELVGDAAKFTRALDGADKSSQAFGQSVERAGRKMTAFVSVPIVGFLGNAVKGASDLNESMSKVDTVFGEAAGSIHTWAAAAATNIGLSKVAAENAAGSFGNMFRQIGFTAAETVNMSTKIVDLSADFASFHNADITEVIAAQEAAFRGEYDSLQRFLPLINAATVEQAAMAMTGKANAKELTAQEKAAAVYKLMLEGAGPAAGDFSRTQDGLANTTRVAAAEMKNASDQIGAQLLPAVTQVAGFVAGTLIPTLDRLSGDNGALVLLGIAAAGPVLSNVNKLVTGVQALNVQLALTAVRAAAALGAVGVVIAGIHEIKNTEGGLAEKILGPSPVSRFIGKIPGLAAGGPVSGGNPYVVGERGPELFVPASSGSIVPAGAGAGAGPTVIQLVLDGRVLTEVVHNGLLNKQRRGPALGLN